MRSLIFIAKFLRFNEFIVAFLIMAVSTSLPELFVGVTSAFNKNPSLSFGTVIGSNIIDVTFIVGLSILLSRRAVKVTKPIIKRHSLFMVLIALLPVVLMALGNQLSRLDGVILVLLFLFFNWHTFRHRGEFKRVESDNVKKYQAVIQPLVFVFSLVGLFFSANYVVHYGSGLALSLGFPNILIGLIFISIGTSLPELVFELKAATSNHIDLAFGDVIGSVITNSSLVLGLTAIIYPIEVNFLFFLTSAVFMLIVCLIFATFMQGTRLSPIHGISLIMLYVLFVIIELSLKGVIPAQNIIS